MYRKCVVDTTKQIKYLQKLRRQYYEVDYLKKLRR